MIGSKTLDFRPQNARLIYGNSDSNGEGQISFYFEGFAWLLSSPLYNHKKKCAMHVYEVDADYEYKEINNPIEEYTDEKAALYGEAVLLMPDKDLIKEEIIEIELGLKRTGLKELEHLVEKAFFPPSAEMGVSLKLIGLKSGTSYLSDSHEIPPEKHLPIIGYSFAIEPKKNESANE